MLNKKDISKPQISRLVEDLIELVKQHAELLREIPIDPDKKTKLAGLMFDVITEVFKEESEDAKLDRTAFICACSEQESLF